MEKNFRTTTDYKRVMQVVSANRSVANRMKELASMGYSIDVAAMGSGGVGQVKEMKDSYRIQISAGWGRYNYAHIVELNKVN